MRDSTPVMKAVMPLMVGPAARSPRGIEAAVPTAAVGLGGCRHRGGPQQDGERDGE